MQGDKLYLWDGDVPLFDESIGQDMPSITPYFCGDERAAAVLICPGGAYREKVDHEKKPIADFFNSIGMHAFTLDYRVTPYHWPAPLLDVKRAVRYLRSNADALHVNPEKIAVIGFSAGGHLAAMAGVCFDGGDPQSLDPVERLSSRPNAFIPCYAVLDMQGEYAHEGSRFNITGQENPSEGLKHELTAWNHVSAATPPCFLFHTAPDTAVPVENSLRMARALHENGVHFALHVFPYGAHGVSMGHNTPLANAFPKLLTEFLVDLGFYY